MSMTDDYFLDVLAGYSQNIRKFTGDILDASDEHFAAVAGYIKNNMPRSWLPKYARPPPPPPPPTHGTAAYLHRAQDWAYKNKALTAAIIAFFATGGILLYREKKKHNRKRRARRASNGARKDVVVIAGPPSSPIVKSLSLDLERRGFIVYIVCADVEEEQQVHSESRADVRPLHLDVVDPFGTRDTMERFNKTLIRPHVAFSGASPHNLDLRGIILVPDLVYPSGPIETITTDLWSDALNAKVLHTIAIAQSFLPTICGFKARVLILTPSIMAALRSPFHGVEAAIVGALDGFTEVLRGEVAPLGIDVCQFKLGTFDITSVGGKQHLESMGSPSTDAWPSAARLSYASNYMNQNRVARSRGLVNHNNGTGSSLRELHVAVFDALTQKHPRRVWRVGRGSVAYDLVGNWAPRGLVGWMLGLRRVSLDDLSEPKLEDSSVQSWEKIETGL